MIDEKKIQEAAFDYCSKCSDITNRNVDLDKDGCVDLHNGFIAGALWVINEFIKDLWHPASEEPRNDVSIIVETHNDKNMFYYAWNRWQDNFYPSWTDAVLCSRVSRWLYINDLFPKEGGENG